MEINQREEELISQIKAKKAANRYKWSYLLIDLISDKIELDMSYSDIAEWLTNQGIQISENTLKNIIWRYKKKNKKLESPIRTRTETILKQRIIQQEKDNIEQKEAINYSEKLRLIEQQEKDKNSGFDQFEGL
ncbi:hypothetical protein CLV98_12340 [Dyadobacter jejuensis]|uniref:Uncharacterized protein n=1 Tax=Dyadobacter jejuensis TaxID=1082580 RepID=A0A316A677_9BACT|nr:hypothetical protein [Dyadobacter jejuensis]PWJ53426.1 hypothetical protein CLV98_12340 [Dyadobacter jejuensis]